MGKEDASLSRRSFLGSALALPFVYSANSAENYEPQRGQAWRHIREWNKNEFDKYSSWVENVYDVKRNGSTRQKTAKIDRIFLDDEMNLLNDSNFLGGGNPQASSREISIFNSGNHCGSFPKLVFLYYNYRRGLPANITKIESGRGGDIRYSSGNHPVKIVKSAPFNGNFGDFLLEGMSGISGGYNFVSGNFRTGPFLENTDSVPIEISKQFVKPGNLVYNANGHCLLVGKIDDSGEVHFLDAHPDRTITFNQTLSAIPSVNSSKQERFYDGFKAMRLAKLKNGESVYFSNGEMEEFGFSISQYNAMREIHNGGLNVEGQNVSSFPSYVRKKLQSTREAPIEFLAKSVNELGEMYRERASFVAEGWNNVLANGAITFPNDSASENIYQANGRWESWSSPSSDVDRKNKYNYVGERLEEMVESFPNGFFDYSGFSGKEEVAKKLLTEKEKLFGGEIISYVSSSGKKFDLSLVDVEQRLFDLSFDPNHAPELRWGAPEGSEERENMKLISTPLNSGGSVDALRIYELEKGLRYYEHRQNTPSSLNPNDNPTSPPFVLIDERLKKFVK